MNEPTDDVLLGKILRKDFYSFIAKTFETVDPGAEFLLNWHIELIAEYLEAARRGEITRLIINMPPRALKSTCVSVAWPAWLLAQDPSAQIVVASYAQSLSNRHSLDCRAVLQSEWYQHLFPEVKLLRAQNQKYKFMTTKRGMRFAASVGGMMTGEGGNFLIIDDPIRAQHAYVSAQRDKVNHWFDHTFSTRLNDKKKGVMVLVMQRLHAEDLTGYLDARGGWEKLILPAVAERRMIHDFGAVTKTREAGEFLHTEREDAELIARARLELGSYAFAAQYQQQPIPDDGKLIKPEWLRRYAEAPAAPERIVQSWDTGIKTAAHHDPSACLTFAELNGVFYLLDVGVMRLEYPDLKRAMIARAEQWKPQAILLEDKASGQQLAQDARRETHLPVIPIMPRHDKPSRVAAISAMIEAGRLILPERAHWLAHFERELLEFPDGVHDDQVDALCQFLDWIRGRSLQSPGLRRL